MERRNVGILVFPEVEVPRETARYIDYPWRSEQR
jgi:hypothetical protein